MPDNPSIDAAFREWKDEHYSKHSFPPTYIEVWRAGAAYGVAKREAVERAAIADLSHEGLSERIRRSSVGERLKGDSLAEQPYFVVVDAGKVDVTG